jgi:hypothetical protein
VKSSTTGLDHEGGTLASSGKDEVFNKMKLSLDILNSWMYIIYISFGGTE